MTMTTPGGAGEALRVRILGTGAMACWLGGLLARTRACEVTLAGTWPAALERLALDGIAWASPDTSFHARVVARALEGDLPAADVAVVLVKAFRTAAVAPHAARALAPGAAVVSLQNGVGATETLATALAQAGQDTAAVQGLATVGARLTGPGEVSVTGRGHVVLPRPPARVETFETFAARLREAGIDVTRVDDIRPHAWRKLVANCAVNALTALHGVRNGALLERADLRRAFEAAAREAGAVARAAGVDLGGDPLALARHVAAATAANRSSMLQDLERGAPTEVDAIHGAVVREARRHGIATPVLEELWQAVREREPAMAR